MKLIEHVRLLVGNDNEKEKALVRIMTACYASGSKATLQVCRLPRDVTRDKAHSLMDLAVGFTHAACWVDLPQRFKDDSEVEEAARMIRSLLRNPIKLFNKENPNHEEEATCYYHTLASIPSLIKPKS